MIAYRGAMGVLCTRSVTAPAPVRTASGFGRRAPRLQLCLGVVARGRRLVLTTRAAGRGALNTRDAWNKGARGAGNKGAGGRGGGRGAGGWVDEKQEALLLAVKHAGGPAEVAHLLDCHPWESPRQLTALVNALGRYERGTGAMRALDWTWTWAKQQSTVGAPLLVLLLPASRRES